jgi:phosphatidylglycerophosphate synthase
MGHYRARDLLLTPSLISLLRVPLAIAFVLALERPVLELLILASAALTDVLDGWWARRAGLVTATGGVVDPVTDKLFVLTVVVTLVVTERLSLFAVLLLSTREIGELPLVVWWSVSHARRRARAEDPVANIPGKLATSAQFLTVAFALFRAPHVGELTWLTAGAGVVAAVSYWNRELSGS